MPVTNAPLPEIVHDLEAIVIDCEVVDVTLLYPAPCEPVAPCEPLVPFVPEIPCTP